jgi:hypothetical protein
VAALEALAAAGRGEHGRGERRDLVDILRSRFSLLIYYRPINVAIFTPDAEKWYSELSGPNIDGPMCHRA